MVKPGCSGLNAERPSKSSSLFLLADVLRLVFQTQPRSVGRERATSEVTFPPGCSSLRA
jgi:hypothetical protein